MYKYKPKSKSVPIKKENTYEDLQKIDKFMDKIIENYSRFVPDFTEPETWGGVFYIIFGIALILIIDYYGRKNK